MIQNKQVELLIDKAIDAYIHGLQGNNDEYQIPARVPSYSDVDVYINNMLDNVVLGKPFFKAIQQDKITSASKFNSNLNSLIDDFTVLTDEMIGQLYAISRHLQLSESEFKKVLNRLKGMNNLIDSILLISNNSNGYLYTIRDTFDNLDNVDMSRTNASVNTNGGFIQIGDASISKYDLGHYKNTVTPDSFNVTTSYKKLDYLSTRFSDCIASIENKYYIVNINTENKSGVGISFTINPESDGSDSKVTEMIMSSVPGYTISVSYKNSKSTDWLSLYKDVTSNTLNKFAIDINDDVSSNGVSSIRIDINNINYISSLNGAFTYSFILKNISLFSNTNNISSTFISNSMKIEGITYLDYTLNQVSIYTEEELPNSTTIDYYIGVDPYVAGKLIDDSNNPVSEYSDNIDAFDPDEDYSGTSGVLASTLRTLQITGYEDWEPLWIPINPLNRQSSSSNTTGSSQSKVINLGNIEVTDSEIDAWNGVIYNSENNINVFSICSFDDKPNNIALLQGKSCWLKKPDEYDNEIEIEEIGSFITVDNINYYLYIGPDYANEDGYIVTRGNVVAGSISSITWFNVDSNLDGNSLVLKDEYPDIIADVYIKYSDGTATIQKNQTATWSYPEYTVKVKYKTTNQSRSKYIYETTYYVPTDTDRNSPIDTSITINDTSNIDYITSENIDSNYIFNGKDVHGNDTIDIQLLSGTNKVKIYASNDFAPSGIIDSPNVYHYAYGEPLTVVGELELLYNTHRDDHTKCAIAPSGDSYLLIVNDPATPSSVITYYNDDIGIMTSGNIFDTSGHLNDFYDLSYHIINEQITNLFVRADLKSESTVSPLLKSYEIRCGDSITL